MSEEKDAEIERLKGELAEAVLLMEQGRECLRQLVALSNVNAETRKMLCYLGNTFNLFLQKHTPPLNCGSAAAGESQSHSGGGVECEPNCRMCSGEYCKIHLNKPCDCDCLDRHGIFQNQETGKSALREVPPTGGKKHEGDCSIYCSDICDCGALRRAVRQNGISDVAVWERWAKHEKAVSAHAITESVKHEKGEK